VRERIVKKLIEMLTPKLVVVVVVVVFEHHTSHFVIMKIVNPIITHSHNKLTHFFPTNEMTRAFVFVPFFIICQLLLF
jgi:hypothetical protein